MSTDGAERAAPAERLFAWGPGFRAEERISGAINTVWSVRRGGERFAARQSRRNAAALAWEFDLLAYLDAAGMHVPLPLLARDGRREIDGLTLLRWLEGAPPQSQAEWRLVAAELTRLHSLTQGWPQRPGFLGTRELLTEESGGDVRLEAMPPAAVQRCRAAWAGVPEEPRSEVHSDPGAPNVRISAQGAGLLDLDEARVDASILDLAALPLPPLAGADDERRERARCAIDAWGAAVGWQREPVYARARLAQLAHRDAPPAAR